MNMKRQFFGCLILIAVAAPWQTAQASPREPRGASVEQSSATAAPLRAQLLDPAETAVFLAEYLQATPAPGYDAVVMQLVQCAGAAAVFALAFGILMLWRIDLRRDHSRERARVPFRNGR